MARMKDLEGVKTGNLFTVALDKLEFEPGFNERDYNDPEVIAQIDGFADAYMNGRDVPPLQVRLSGEKILVVDGHQRTLGARKAKAMGAEIVGLQCTQFTGNDVDRLAYMVTSSQGLPLSPVGRARAYYRLIKLGLSNEEIAKRVGKTAAHVSQYLTLASANVDVQQMVNRREVAFSLAIEVVREHGDDAGKVLATEQQKAADKGKTKVTRGTMGKKKPSNVEPLIAASRPLQAIVSERIPTDATDEQLDGVTVMVPAKLLKALVDALAKVKNADPASASAAEAEAVPAAK